MCFKLYVYWYQRITDYGITIFVFFLFAFDFCWLCVVIGFVIPATTANDLRRRTIFLFLRKSQYFQVYCSVLNKGTTGTSFTTFLVWRGPWLGIEPGTSRTRSFHSTTRLEEAVHYQITRLLWNEHLLFRTLFLSLYTMEIIFAQSLLFIFLQIVCIVCHHFKHTLIMLGSVPIMLTNAHLPQSVLSHSTFPP